MTNKLATASRAVPVAYKQGEGAIAPVNNGTIIYTSCCGHSQPEAEPVPVDPVPVGRSGRGYGALLVPAAGILIVLGMLIAQMLMNGKQAETDQRNTQLETKLDAIKEIAGCK